MKKNKEILDKYLIIPTITLLITLIIKFIQFTNIYKTKYFLGDLFVHLPNLFFLGKYHLFTPVLEIFNGQYALLQSYPIGWFYFSLPILGITKDIFITTFISIALIFILGFIFTWLLGDVLNISKIKRLFFYAIVFANPLILNTLFDTGRIPDFFSWLLFIPSLALIFKYKNKGLDLKFYTIFTFIYTFMFLSHIWISIIVLFLILGLLLKQPFKKWVYLALCFIIIAIITSFWWMPFIDTMTSGFNAEFTPGNQFMQLNSIISFNTVFILLLWIVFLFYWKAKNYSKKELLFFLPVFLLSFILLTRIIVLIPILNKIPANPFNYFMLFLIVIYFLKTDFAVYPKLIKKAVPYLMIVLALSFLFLSFGHFTGEKEYTSLQNDMISLLPYVEGRYLILGTTSRDVISDYVAFGPIVAYATIYYNLETPSGNYYHGAPLMYMRLRELNHKFQDGDCKLLRKEFYDLNLKSLISHDRHCETLKRCGFLEVKVNGSACLYQKS